MYKNPAFIFGAGATKACGGPLTNEILPKAFRLAEDNNPSGTFNKQRLSLVNSFLVQIFHVPPDIGSRQNEDYPALPLVLELLDTAIDKKQSLGATWELEKLMEVRTNIEYIIFALIEYTLRSLKHNYFLDLLRSIRDIQIETIGILSLNYDIIIDNTICNFGDDRGQSLFADYGIDIQTEYYHRAAKFGRLYKLHGSLNWLYCPSCHRLELKLSQAGTETSKAVHEFYSSSHENSLNSYYEGGTGFSRCPECYAAFHPILITPTHLKDYRNPHIARIWYEAERLLRQADRAFIIGYSLPENDVEVAYLLKRGLGHLTGSAITVVEYDPVNHRSLKEHDVGRRYRSLFGDGLDWHTEGFGEWLNSFNATGKYLLD
jgi:hypothetical protein